MCVFYLVYLISATCTSRISVFFCFHDWSRKASYIHINNVRNKWSSIFFLLEKEKIERVASSGNMKLWFSRFFVTKKCSWNVPVFSDTFYDLYVSCGKFGCVQKLKTLKKLPKKLNTLPLIFTDALKPPL